jgi:hypothetical protein
MSGGHFDYTQDRLNGVLTEMEHILSNPEKFALTEYAIGKITEAIKNIKIAQIYIQRVDWYISGDDAEETFKKRLEKDLSNV